MSETQYTRCLCSFPKSGRTWLWYAADIAAAFEAGVDPEPYRMRNRAKHRKNPLFDAIGIPWATSTHDAPDSGNPKLDQHLFLMIRDPRDVLVSTFYWRSHSDPFSKHVQREGTRLARWAWKWDQDERTFDGIIAYEDLHNDFHNTLARFLDWLEAPYSDEAIEHAREAASFENMKACQYDDGQEPARLKMRKGTTGDWTSHFSKADEQSLAEILNEYPCSYWERYDIGN